MSSHPFSSVLLRKRKMHYMIIIIISYYPIYSNLEFRVLFCTTDLQKKNNGKESLVFSQRKKILLPNIIMVKKDYP